MSYLFLNPEFKRLETELCAMDRQRDHLRAQMADAALRVDLAEVDRNLPWGLKPEERAEVKAEREAAIRARIEVRARRRANEMRIFGSYTRPGTWDADLDKYQEPRYEEAVGEYRIRLVRARDLTWNGYVLLPAGHCAANKHYDFFGGYESPAGLPLPPQNLTYNAVEDGRGVFGFYLTGIVKPREDYGDYTRYNHYSVEQTGASAFEDDGSVHVSYEKMRARCLGLVDYFKGLAADPSLLSPPAPAAAEPEAEPVQYFTSMRAPPARRAVTPQTAPATSAEPKPKKSWAAVARSAAGK
jgi:hypothetical protein